MSIKLTYEEVKEYIESFNGYKLLSEEYKNNITKLKIQCPEEHIFWKSYSAFKQGQRCPKCYYNSKKLTYEEVKSYIESFEHKLISTKYKNNKTKLEMKCPEGHIFSMTYGNFQSNKRCPECHYNSIKLPYEEVKSGVESIHGYKLLSKEYVSSSTKIEIQCPLGHVFWVSYNTFQQGHRCPECAKEKYGEYHKLTYEEVKKHIQKRKYNLLSKEYKNAFTKLEIQCPEGHVFWMKYNGFQQGYGCPECAGNKKLSNQEIIDKLSFCEDIRETQDKQLEIKCTYCGEWHIPERKNLITRVGYIEGKVDSESRIYCSQQCKEECPIYKQILYPKDFKPATSREVQPQLRQMVLKRDNYTCQKCGKHKDELDVGLHCHHIYPLNESPITSADIDECITLCKECHKEVHMNTAGCGYSEMRCSGEDSILI